MKKNLKLCLCLVVILVLSVMAGCGGSQTPADPDPAPNGETPRDNIQLTFAAGPAGGSWTPLAAAMAEVLMTELDYLDISVQQGGGVGNLVGIESGMYDIGISYGHTAAEAVLGIGPFDTAHNNLTGLVSLYNSSMQIVVRADSDIYEIEDLKGTSVNAGTIGFTGEVLFRDILEIHGMSYDDLGRVEHISYSDGTSLFRDRHLDSITQITAVPAAPITEVAASFDVRVISLRPEKYDEFFAKNSGINKFIVPAGTYSGHDEDAITIGSMAMLAISKDLPEDVVYDITRVLLENRDKFLSVTVLMNQFTKEAAHQSVGLDLHPGSEKYFKEIGQR
jgi:TRAP transporter TAXI family solute receptor